MTDKIVVAGFGGQGVITMGELLAFIAMRAGLNTTHYPSYGAEMRGGTANCAVTVSDDDIHSPVFSRPTSLLVMNEPSFRRFEPIVASGGLVVIDASRVTCRTGRGDLEELAVPASETAERLGQVRVANIVLMAAFLRRRPLFPADLVRDSIARFFAAKGKTAAVPLNLAAFDAGYALA